MNSKSHHHKHIEPVTLVFSFTVKKGKEKEFEQWAHEITDAGKHFEGHLGSNWIHTSNNSRNYVVVIKFLDVNDSKKWLRSSVRKRLLQKMYPLVEEDKANRLQNVTGLETWFTLPGRMTLKPPPRWKMVIVTMIGIYPIGLIYQAYLLSYLRLLPLFLRPIALSLILTPILTYVIMPQLTKLLRKWLYPET
jgi:antibiotic biosynthesis monooxygenase (ABM) superfamily enzyme